MQPTGLFLVRLPLAFAADQVGFGSSLSADTAPVRQRGWAAAGTVMVFLRPPPPPPLPPAVVMPALPAAPPSAFPSDPPPPVPPVLRGSRPSEPLASTMALSKRRACSIVSAFHLSSARMSSFRRTRKSYPASAAIAASKNRWALRTSGYSWASSWSNSLLKPCTARLGSTPVG
ncbi:hypothetical protein VaNZ11_016640 [Volvox africanus]|uniref:Secreted protein n=1 Tax=Volvox africanus TaxID=51714 RepID=A0ABQ5SP72_9CHLO|nr:hypothetical protein VaNZ11_016640 [Volvox africanus]